MKSTTYHHGDPVLLRHLQRIEARKASTIGRTPAVLVTLVPAAVAVGLMVAPFITASQPVEIAPAPLVVGRVTEVTT